MDHDGKVSFSDYATAVQDEPLLLQVFGPVLPDVQVSTVWLTNIACILEVQYW